MPYVMVVTSTTVLAEAIFSGIAVLFALRFIGWVVNTYA